MARRYCLDANVFVEAKNRYYAFDIVPVFWAWLEQAGQHGTVYSSTWVYEELKAGNDDLARWIRAHKAMFVEPSAEVQAVYAQIVQFVATSYQPQHVERFLGGADPWIVAQTLVDKSVLVTHEKAVSASSKKIKIPNVYARFSQEPCRNTFQMLRELDVSLGG